MSSGQGTKFVDPRMDPMPQSERPSGRHTDDLGELEELHVLCRLGRLYDVERWIRQGKPLQLAAGANHGRRRTRSALEIALDRQDHALILLLVVNGYDAELESESPLNAALRLRRMDLLDLLLDWGADPKRVSPDTLFETYTTSLFERFRALGLDLTAGHSVAYALGEHTSNKPLFGFVKRHRIEDPRIQSDLNIALAHHAGEGNEKGVMLCLWAGGDPHALVPSLRYLGYGDVESDEDEGSSAIHMACIHGHAGILERLGLDPTRDDYDQLFCWATNEKTIALLARSALPRDPGKVISLQLARAGWPFHDFRPSETLRALFEAGIRWRTSPVQEIANARRNLLRCSDYVFSELMRLLTAEDHCSSEILAELARTPSIRQRLKKVGLIPETWPSRSIFNRSRTSKTALMLEKLGLDPRPAKQH